MLLGYFSDCYKWFYAGKCHHVPSCGWWPSASPDDSPGYFLYSEKLSQIMHVPSEHYWGAFKHLLCYLNGTRSLGIWLLVETPLALHCFYDADWVCNPDDHISIIWLFLFSLVLTQFHRVLQSNTLLLVLLLRLTIVPLWLSLLNCNGKSLLSELLAPVQLLPTMFSDNLGATYLSANPVFHSCMKHLANDYHFDWDLVQSSKLRVVHVSSGDQLADALTKPLSRSRLFFLCNKIGVITDTPS